jgi:two-component system chemotaxis response regulator CheV
VLFADDSRTARTLTRQTLERLGVGWVEACDGAEAWAILERLATTARSAAAGRGRSGADGDEEPLFAIVTDVEMPVMDGFELTRRVKSDPRFAAVPLVMHSSLSEGANAERARLAGADAYIPKFDAQGLARTLSDLAHRISSG